MNYCKKVIFSLSVFICFCISYEFAVFSEEKPILQNSSIKVSSKVEISIVYSRQSGWASNQFAVWIEDTNGRYIKTLFVTRFTAKGGWKYRSESIPSWIKAAQIGNLSEKQIDSITGATPSSGNLIYVWDCKDNNNNLVPAAEYRYYVEGTLRWKNRVLYSGVIKTGGTAQQSKATNEFFGDSTEEKNMITNVIAKYYP